ncbi:peptidase C1 [bacterium]|nr:MAG: peptidase C1 [bacterium]
MPEKIISADGTERQLKGYKRSAPQVGTKTYSKAQSNVSDLPSKVDLRKLMSAVENQGGTSSCTANATAGAYEYLLKRHRDEELDVSRLFIYYNARYVSPGDYIEDEGSTIVHVIEGLKKYGACTEDTWAFDEDMVNEEPDESSYEEGAYFLVESAKQVPVDLETWKTALAEGQPIIFGISIFKSFDKHKKKGLVSAPTKNELARETHAGHAMLCVGYSDVDEVFIIRNSWGTGWGDKGYCYIPYNYLMNPEYNDGDCWIIERLEELPPDEETWSEDEESVLEEAATVLSEMDDDEYEEFVEGMGEYPFEQRLALLFLTAVGADGDISDDEIEVIKEHLAPVLEQTGGSQNAAGIIRAATRLVGDEEILQESMDVIWNHFDYDVLASITNQIEEAAGADGLARAERKFIDALVAYWQDGDEEEEDSEEEEEEE